MANTDNSGGTKDTTHIQSVSGHAYVIRVRSSEHVTNPIKNKEYNESVWYFQTYKLTAFTVRTLNPFDSTHAANSDISSYFLTDYGAQYTLEEFISSKRLNEKYQLTGYKEDFTTSIDLMLMKAPTIKGQHRFEVKMTFDNGSSFADTANVILL